MSDTKKLQRRQRKTKRRLERKRMIIPIDPTVETEYVPICEEGQDDPTTFMLKFPDLRVMEQIENDSIEMVTEGEKNVHRIKSGTQKVVLLLNGVVGWKFFGDIEFDRNDVEGSINRIPLDIRDELYAKLRGSEEVLDGIRERYEKRKETKVAK